MDYYEITFTAPDGPPYPVDPLAVLDRFVEAYGLEPREYTASSIQTNRSYRRKPIEKIVASKPESIRISGRSTREGVECLEIARVTRDGRPFWLYTTCLREERFRSKREWAGLFVIVDELFMAAKGTSGFIHLQSDATQQNASSLYAYKMWGGDPALCRIVKDELDRTSLPGRNEFMGDFIVGAGGIQYWGPRFVEKAGGTPKSGVTPLKDGAVRIQVIEDMAHPAAHRAVQAGFREEMKLDALARRLRA